MDTVVIITPALLTLYRLCPVTICACLTLGLSQLLTHLRWEGTPELLPEMDLRTGLPINVLNKSKSVLVSSVCYWPSTISLGS